MLQLPKVCRQKLEELLGPRDSRVCDFTSTPSMIMHLFKSCTSPSVTKSARGKVDLPESFTVRIGGSNSIYSLLGDPVVGWATIATINELWAYQEPSRHPKKKKS